MAKKMKSVVVGSVVAFNNLLDTYWFDVLAIDGFNMTIREHGKPNYAEQYMDISFVKQVK